MDEVCRVCSVCGLPTYLSVDRCPYCGEKYGDSHETTDYNLINLCTVNERFIVTSVYNRIAMDVTAVPINELRKLYGLKDI